MVQFVPMGGAAPVRYRQGPSQDLVNLQLIQALAGNVGQIGNQFRAQQQLARQDAASQAFADVLAGRAGGQLGAGGMGPPTPAQPGMMPSADQVKAMILGGVDPTSLLPPTPEPITPYQQQRLDIARQGLEQPTSTEQRLAGAGIQPGTPEAREFLLGRQQPGTTVKVPPQFPSPPAGWHYEGNFASGDVRLVQTPGGPADIAAQETAAKAASKQAGAERQLRTVTRETGRVLDIIEDPEWTSGVVAYGLSRAPGTDAYQAQRSIDTLGAIISFDTLNRMRAESPTGGALGSVTEGELALLRSVHGSLDIAQDPDVLAENLELFEHELDAVVNGTAPPEPAGPTRNLGTGEVTATNPATGETLVLRNGQWVPR